VPIALVTLVEPGWQVFPGMYGLAERPLSLCPELAGSTDPVTADDVRLAGYPNAVSYAGMPLTDESGTVLGALCAIDTVPRQWLASELALLGDLAAACSDSLRLRIASSSARRREDEVDGAFERSQLLLRASVALADTRTAHDVVTVVRDLVTGTLDPAFVGLSLLDETGAMTLQSGLALPARIAARWSRYSGTAAVPSALATRLGAAVLLPDLAAVRELTPSVIDTFTEMGWESAASVPLPGPAGSIGALTFVWKQPYRLDPGEQTILVALAGYVAQAMRRADHLSSRENAATVLQRALLTELPDAAPFELAARYEPAAREHVGGDWYDAVRLDPYELAVIVGDVTGHDMRAAARMGQLRSKLRLLVIDRHEPPAALLRRLDSANQALGDQITGTAVLAYVRPEPDGDGHLLQWANAGHPSPLLVTAAGVTELTGHDPMLGVLRRAPRTSRTQHLPPGSTVLFYTDGLIETRAASLVERERQLREMLPGLAGLPLPDLLDRLYTQLAGDDHEDDVAMLALRTPRTPSGNPIPE